MNKLFHLRKSIAIKSLACFFYLMGTMPASAQVGINTDKPDPSSILDLTDTERGLLIPRMTSGDRLNISLSEVPPANALLVYDKEDKRFYFYDAGTKKWKAVNMWTYEDDPAKEDEPVYFKGDGNVGIGTAKPVNKLSVVGDVGVTGSIGVNTTTPESEMHVKGTGSIIIPSGTTDQRPDISSAGGLRFNTTTQTLEVFNGTKWASGGSPFGTIMPFAGGDAKIPNGWLLCDGSEVSRTTYADLFAAIGVSWGSGNGSSTFNLPDLRGRFLRGVDKGAGRDPDHDSRAANAPGGNTGNKVGSVQEDEIKSHAHGVSDPGHAHEFNDTYNVKEQSDNADDRNVGSDRTTTVPNTTQAVVTGISIDATGGNETRPENAYVNYIIKF